MQHNFFRANLSKMRTQSFGMGAVHITAYGLGKYFLRAPSSALFAFCFASLASAESHPLPKECATFLGIQGTSPHSKVWCIYPCHPCSVPFTPPFSLRISWWPGKTVQIKRFHPPLPASHEISVTLPSSFLQPFVLPTIQS